MPYSYFDAENNNHKSFELPGAKPHYNPDRPGQVEHIFLDLNLDIPNQSYTGICKIALKPVTTGINRLSLDAVNLNIQSVDIDGTPQSFDYDDAKLDIRLETATEVGKVIKIAIAYFVEK